MPTRRGTLRTWIVFGWVACVALMPRAAAATGAEPATATHGQKNEAQRKFDKGRSLSAAKRYPEALAEFRASYEIVASPNTHFSIGRALVAVGQLADAYVEFGKTVTEAHAAAPKDKRYQQTADAAEVEQRELRPKLAFLALSVEHADRATVKVGDREIDATALGGDIPVTPGTVTVVVSSGGAEVARQSVAVSTGDRKTIVIDALPNREPVPAPVEMHEVPTVTVDRSPRGLRTAAYVAGGVGVVGLATFAVFGALEKSTYNDLQSACNAGPCPPEKADDISTGRSRQTIANVGLVAGIAGLAAGAVLFVLGAPTKSPASARASLVVAPGFVGVGGSL